MTLWNDIKYSFRQLRKRPGLIIFVVLSLALGIGANTTVLCWFQAIVFNPIPGAKNTNELVVLVSNRGGGNISWLDFKDFDKLDEAFAGVSVSQTTPAYVRIGKQSEWLNGQIASANYFDLLGVKPIMGRTFLPEEDNTPGGHPVMVISERYWQRRFAGDKSIIGKTVDLNRHQFEIVGVVPAEFRGTMVGTVNDFWAPITMQKEVANYAAPLTSRSSRPFHNLARLKPGISIEQAQAAVDILNSQLAQTYPKSNLDVEHRVVTLAQCPYGAKNLIPMLTLILAVSLGVLLIVATNVSNLLLARTISRQKEISIRMAAGAGRLHIIQQLLIESLLLALLGGLAGAIYASWAVNIIPRFISQALATDLLTFRLDGTTLILTFILTVLTGLFFGLIPALQVFRPRLYETLQQGGRSGGTGTMHHRLHDILVISEVSMALVLLIAAGLCLRGFMNAKNTDFGFNPRNMLVAEMHIGMNGYNEETGIGFYNRLEKKLRNMPGVQQASLSSWFPLGFSGCKGLDVYVDGYIRPPGEDETYNYSIISGNYFDTMGIPLLAGRDFTEQDNADATHVGIINEELARRFWPNQDPIGRKFRSHGIWRTVVGVVPTGKYRLLNEKPLCFFYLPYRQGVRELNLNICVRTSGPPESFAASLRQAIREIDPDVDVHGIQPMTSYIQGALFVQHIASSMLAVLGLVSLILAAMGVYAVMAYSVSQRTQEFGIRMALGAKTHNVLYQVIRKGLILAGVGIVFGLALSVIVTRLLTSFLYGVSPFDLLTFAGVSLLLMAVIILACLRPALRAAGTNPMEALRYE